VSIEDLDPIIHAPKRLVVMSILASSVSSDFAFLRQHLEVSDSDISKQMAVLDKAGYVSIIKSGRGRGSVTRYRITRAGRAAFERHIAALSSIVGKPAVTDGAQPMP